MKNLLLVLIVVFMSCGSLPYDTCTNAQEKRCAGDVVELCDGELWHPVIDCTETLYKGEMVEGTCDEITATCERDLK